jgi:predicted Fe-Mo cluster-binding NifX family protein
MILNMAKIFAISSSGKTEKSFLDLRFGKCENVVIYNQENDQYSIFENSYKDASHSGIKLVNHLKQNGVTTIITGEVGPMVSDMLEKEKLQLVLLSEERIKIEDILNRIRK